MDVVSYEQLVDLAEGRLDPEEAAVLRALIAGHPPVAAQLAELERLVSLMRTDTSEDAPEHLIRRALRIVHRVEPESLPVRRDRRFTLLISDSWRMPGMAQGLRSLQAWPRAIVLRAGDRELDLQVAPRGEQWQVSGQVLGPEMPGEVTLSGPAAHVVTALNDLGEFILPAVVGGHYTLTVVQGDLEIVVPNLEIGPASSIR